MKINYNDAQKALETLGSEHDAAEFHGIFSGIIGSGDYEAAASFASGITSESDTDNLLARNAADIINKLMTEAVTEFKGGCFSFSPLILEEDEDLSLRIKGLRSWCDGFLYGYGIAVKKPDNSAQIMEILHDFSEIARLDCQKTPDSSELDFMEVYEYVRAGAMLVFEHSRQNEG